MIDSANSNTVRVCAVSDLLGLLFGRSFVGLMFGYQWWTEWRPGARGIRRRPLQLYQEEAERIRAKSKRR